MKFLILWEFELAGLRPEVIPAVARMPDYAATGRGASAACRRNLTHIGACP